jgi:hypothetical protein
MASFRGKKLKIKNLKKKKNNNFNRIISILFFFSHEKWNFCIMAFLKSFLAPERQKIIFFNFIKIVKNVREQIFDKRFCYFYILDFFLIKSIFGLFTRPPFSRMSVKWLLELIFGPKRQKTNFIKI